MSKTAIIILSIGIVLFTFCLSLIGFSTSSYNSLISKREVCNYNWAQVDNQLKRRSDLIPNLVNIVKGYASHEKEIFTNIAQARANIGSAKTLDEKISANKEMDSCISRLLVIVENYPNLKANESFNRLMDELSGTENRISVERMRYNESIQYFNTYKKVFPRNILTGIFNFVDMPYYKIEEKDKEVPKIEF